MNETELDALVLAAERFGTPCYVYFDSAVVRRVEKFREIFDENFGLNYAVKVNPNSRLLRRLKELGVGLDVSSIGEFERGLAAGFSPAEIGFTGPGKRNSELSRAIDYGAGHVICESLDELTDVNAIAARKGTVQSVLLRLTPAKVPKRFGLNMAGQASQFGIDEEDIADVAEVLQQCESVNCQGFHAFSAGNSLSVGAIAQNFDNMCNLFLRSAEVLRCNPELLVFGSGFGIPYFEGDQPLDLLSLGKQLNARARGLRKQFGLPHLNLCLEMGRWIVGEAGYLVTSVVRTKQSRGQAILICDAGFNNNLSAAGMMGTVMRRDWRFTKLEDSNPLSELVRYRVVGPLCASFDILATNVALPPTGKGDKLAIASCGAYGLTASPTRFISHPEPKELLVHESVNGIEIIDVSESLGSDCVEA